MLVKSNTKRAALATLFGAILFLSKIVVPSPIDKMVIGVHALLLALGALLLKRMGATYVAIIGGVLTAFWRMSTAPFTLGFTLLYGLFVDVFFFIFKTNLLKGNVKSSTLVASLTVSTALVGLISYYTTVFLFGLLQRNPVLEASMLIIGDLNGAIAGYFTSIFWNDYLKNIKL